MVWVPIDTIIETAYRRVCPLYTLDERDRIHLIGSAVPFKSGSHAFLITAAHTCFKEQKPISLFVYGKNRPHALLERRGAWGYIPGQTPDLDIAVIGLDNACATELQANYWFCTQSDVSTVRPKTPGIHYLIAGYPASRNRSRPIKHGLPSKATALISGDIRSVTTLRGVDKSDEHHFAISLPFEKVPKAGGGEFHVPKPQGMSGGGVWRLEINTRSRYANSPVLVGIGIEYYKKQKTFLATKVQVVAALARDLADPDTPTRTA